MALVAYEQEHFLALTGAKGVKMSVRECDEMEMFNRQTDIRKGLSGNMFSSFKGAPTGRLMVFSGQNWYQRMHFLYAEALVKATCLIIPIFIV